jgi:hypothetical protein
MLLNTSRKRNAQSLLLLRYRTDNKGTGIRFPTDARDFSLLYKKQTDFGVRPAQPTIRWGLRALSPGQRGQRMKLTTRRHQVPWNKFPLNIFSSTTRNHGRSVATELGIQPSWPKNRGFIHSWVGNTYLYSTVTRRTLGPLTSYPVGNKGLFPKRPENETITQLHEVRKIRIHVSTPLLPHAAAKWRSL